MGFVGLKYKIIIPIKKLENNDLIINLKFKSNFICLNDVFKVKKVTTMADKRVVRAAAKIPKYGTKNKLKVKFSVAATIYAIATIFVFLTRLFG